MVATSQPLAAQAGLEMLKQGGNAIDAALCTAIALTVLEPTSNGIGGDAFCLIWDGKTLHGLNGSGAAPNGISPETLKEQGLEAIPTHGWLPVTVPGAPRSWADLHARFGRLPFEKLFEPALHYARNGFPLSPRVAHLWQRSSQLFSSAPFGGSEFAGWRNTFMPISFQPRAGTIWASEDHARTLERIAHSKAEDFYSGELATKIDRFARETGGILRHSDLEQHRSEWVQPISTTYRGHQVWEIPPSGQGIVALEALGILEGLALPSDRNSVQAVHFPLEAVKLAFADAERFIGDSRFGRMPDLLEPDYLQERRALISEAARFPEAGRPKPGGTVYLCAADSSGMMVSFIQSNYMGFGSGVVVPGTGIALQNRGHNFSLESGHPNLLEGGKRPYHTIIPGFLTKDGAAVGPFGVMGGFMQPQGHVQVMVNTLEYGLGPQAALNAPRWRWTEGLNVELERGMPPEIALELQKRGHQVVSEADSGGFGCGQIIWRDRDGTLIGGSDPRADGCVAAF